LRQLALNLLLTFTSFLALILLCELFFRFPIWSETKKSEWSDRPKFYYDPEGALDHTAQTHNKKKAANTFRIAVVGDSYSFGPFMQYDDTFAGKLNRMLNLNNSTIKTEVINYGISGYSTTQEFNLTKRALEEEADLVILQITLNDAELKPYTPDGVIISTNKYGAYVVSPETPKIIRYSKFLTFVAGRLHNYKSKGDYKNYYLSLYDQKHVRGKLAFKNALNNIKSLCDSKKVPLVAVIFPLFGTEIDDNYPFNSIHELIGKILTKRQIPYLDLKNEFASIPTLRLQVIPGIDFHPNEIAHRMAAETLYSWLIEQGFLPEELKIKSIYKLRNHLKKTDN